MPMLSQKGEANDELLVLAVAANVVTIGTAVALLYRWIKRQQRKRQRRRSKLL